MIFERTKKDMAALEIRDQVTVYDASGCSEIFAKRLR